MGLSWRGRLHGTVGAELRVLGEPGEGGFFLRVPAMVELHNSVTNPTPNNYWRGLLGLRVGYQRPPGGALGGAAISVDLQHESDHATVDLIRGVGNPYGPSDVPIGYFQLNSVGVTLAMPLELLDQEIVISAAPSVHVLTCTVDVTLCASGRDGYGSVGFQGTVQAVWTGRAPAPPPGAFGPFAAAYLSWLFPHALIAEERRFIVNAGTWVRTERRGSFAFFAIGWTGNDEGYLRRSHVTQVGAAFRWTP